MHVCSRIWNGCRDPRSGRPTPTLSELRIKAFLNRCSIQDQNTNLFAICFDPLWNNDSHENRRSKLPEKTVSYNWGLSAVDWNSIILLYRGDDLIFPGRSRTMKLRDQIWLTLKVNDNTNSIYLCGSSVALILAWIDSLLNTVLDEWLNKPVIPVSNKQKARQQIGGQRFALFPLLWLPLS